MDHLFYENGIREQEYEPKKMYNKNIRTEFNVISHLYGIHFKGKKNCSKMLVLNSLPSVGPTGTVSDKFIYPS